MKQRIWLWCTFVFLCTLVKCFLTSDFILSFPMVRWVVFRPTRLVSTWPKKILKCTFPVKFRLQISSLLRCIMSRHVCFGIYEETLMTEDIRGVGESIGLCPPSHCNEGRSKLFPRPNIRAFPPKPLPFSAVSCGRASLFPSEEKQTSTNKKYVIASESGHLNPREHFGIKSRHTDGLTDIHEPRPSFLDAVLENYP